MKIRLAKSMVLSSSLFLALTTFSGCGKDKEVKSSPPTAQTTPADTQTPQNGGELNSAPGTATNPDTTLTQPTAPSTQAPGSALPQTQQPTIPAQNEGNEVLPDLPPLQLHGTNQQGPQLLPTIDEEIAKNAAMRAYQIDFSKASPIRTGGTFAELLFTSVGNDGLMEEFKQYNLKVTVSQQVMNTNLAKAIVNAKLARATSAGQISLTLTIDEFGTLHTYKMNASSDGEKMNLALSKVGTTGGMEFQGGFVKCLDRDGGCSVAYAKIKIAGGYARVIFRNVAADLHFLIQDEVSGNAAFSAMSNYILNATNSSNVQNKIEGMNLSSFEVIHGRAGAGAMLTTLDRQVVGFNIPMAVSGIGADVNTNVAKNADLSKNYDLVNLTKSYSVELSRSINQVRLVKNDGRGDFKLQLMYGTDDAPASIWIVAASMQRPIISLEKIRSFESKLKAF